MDIIETVWEWNSRSFSYVQGPSKEVKAETLLEARIARVYAGGVDVYEQYLEGAWYKESGDGSEIDMLFFDPAARELVFYDGSVQEVYHWGESIHTTPQRLYLSTNNAVIPSLSSKLSVIADSWESIQIKWTASKDDFVTYRRLGPALQSVLDAESSLDSLSADIGLAGVWKSPGGDEIAIDKIKETN